MQARRNMTGRSLELPMTFLTSTYPCCRESYSINALSVCPVLTTFVLPSGNTRSMVFQRMVQAFLLYSGGLFQAVEVIQRSNPPT